MTKLPVLLVFFGSVSALAQGGGAADLLNVTKSPFDNQKKPTSGVTVTVTCKSADGTEIKPGEAGYEACANRRQHLGSSPADHRNQIGLGVSSGNK